jgi:hypothetical protein
MQVVVAAEDSVHLNAATVLRLLQSPHYQAWLYENTETRGDLKSSILAPEGCRHESRTWSGTDGRRHHVSSRLVDECEALECAVHRAEVCITYIWRHYSTGEGYKRTKRVKQ